jgi:hypothetical protein
MDETGSPPARVLCDEGVVVQAFCGCEIAFDPARASATRPAASSARSTRSAFPESARVLWLTAGAGVAVLTQEDLQAFLWYGLPMKWLTDAEHHRRVVHALARGQGFGVMRYFDPVACWAYVAIASSCSAPASDTSSV